MRVVILDNKQAVGEYAANIVEEQLAENPDSVLGKATGSTPIPLYQELIRKYEKKELDFSRVITFNLDEYLLLGLNLKLDAKKDQSYHRFMWENFWQHINIKYPENTYILNGLTPNPERHCELYEKQIVKAGGIDLQILGIGSDGHIAFDEPGSSLSSRTRVKYLLFSTLVDNYDAFVKEGGYDFTDMPVFSITEGVGTVMEAKKVILLATGRGKGKALAALVEGPVTSQVTATALQYHRNFTVIADKEAAEGKELTQEKPMKRDGLRDLSRHQYAMRAEKLYSQMQAARIKGATIDDLKTMQKKFLEEILAKNFGGIQELLEAKQKEK